MVIKGTTGSTTKERVMLSLLEMEMVVLRRSRETPGIKLNVAEKQKEFYLIFSLTTASPPDTLDHWLIDSGASRHFIGYKEVLSNLIENDTNLETIFGENATYPVKGVGNVTLQLNHGNTIHLQ